MRAEPLRAQTHPRQALTRPYRERPEVEARLVDLELTERRFALLCRSILLLSSVALVATAIVCALRGGAWPIASSTCGFGTITGTLSVVAERRSV